jgi:hypothetical protein
MRYRLTVIVVLVSFLITACSSTASNRGNYDELDLIEYENCLQGTNEASIAYLKTEGGKYNYDKVVEYCKTWKPKKTTP